MLIDLIKTYLQTHRGVNRKWEILIPSMERHNRVLTIIICINKFFANL